MATQLAATSSAPTNRRDQRKTAFLLALQVYFGKGEKTALSSVSDDLKENERCAFVQ